MNAPKPQRVLYIVSLFPCWSETFIVREIEQLLALGVDVRILSLKRPTEKLVQARAAGLMNRLVGPPSFLSALLSVVWLALRHPLKMAGVLGTLAAQLWRRPVALAKSLVALWRGIGALPTIRRQDPQLIHAHWATYPSTVAWALGRLTGTPFSFTCHAHDIFVEDQLLRRKLADAALVVTISGFNRRHLARWGAEDVGERLQVVHCGVDFAELPTQGGTRRDGAIVSVGRLDPIKGFDVLLAALGRLRDRGVAFDCHVIGEGPLRPSLESQRRDLQLEPLLSMPGAQPQEKVRSALVESSIFVMPSVVTPEGNQDGIPVALMEAMACGMAVVGTRVSGIPELIENDVSGILVEPGDSQALAAAIERLLQDASLRQRLGAVARERVKQDFDVAAETRRLLGLFGKVLPPQELPDARWRILIVTDEMEVGGSQRQIVHLLQGIKDSGRDPQLLYFRKPSFLLEQVEAAGVAVHRIDKRGRIDLGFLVQLVRFLRRGRFDVVHCFSITAEMWVRLALYAVSGTRLVSSVRGMSKGDADWHWRAKRWIVAGSAAVIANSLLAAEWVAVRSGVAIRRFSIVNNGIDLPAEPSWSERQATRTALGVADGQAMVLFVGRLVALKNIGLLLRALASMAPGARPALRLAGDGPERVRIEQEIAERGLENEVRLLGERDDVPALMSAADVFVLSSREEGLSNVILEAMGSGLAVVATAVGGTPELIEDGVSGHLVPDDDSAALATVLGHLAQDHATRKRLGGAARRRVSEHFSIEAMVRATLAIYDGCVRSEAARA